MMRNPKYGLLPIVVVLMAVAPAFAGSITVYGTGYNLTSNFEPDLNYVLQGGFSGILPAGCSNFPCTTYTMPAFPGWYPPDAPWQWITPYSSENDNAPVGNYDYRTTFMLPSNFSSATLSGMTAMDNSGMVYLNGDLILTISGIHGFEALHPFSDSTRSDFLPGLNTLDFVVNNIGGPTGLLVENISGSYNGGSTPEPGTFLLLGSGVLGFIGVLRRRLRR